MTYLYSEEEIRRHRRIWCNALLQSSVYRQGKKALVKETKKGVRKFCCLGVGIDKCGYALNYRLDEKSWNYIRPAKDYEITNVVTDSHLPVDMLAYFGLNQVQQDMLIKLNDDDDVKFSAIAVIIPNLEIHYKEK